MYKYHDYSSQPLGFCGQIFMSKCDNYKNNYIIETTELHYFITCYCFL